MFPRVNVQFAMINDQFNYQCSMATLLVIAHWLNESSVGERIRLIQRP